MRIKASKIATQVCGMQVCLGNGFRLATPLQLRLTLCTFYYLDTESDTCMKTKIIVIYCNTSHYTYIHKYTIL